MIPLLLAARRRRGELAEPVPVTAPPLPPIVVYNGTQQVSPAYGMHDCVVCGRETRTFPANITGYWICTDRQDCIEHRPVLASCP